MRKYMLITAKRKKEEVKIECELLLCAQRQKHVASAGS